MAARLVSVFALVFRHAPPLLTSPVDGGGIATPSPPAGRVGVGVPGISAENRLTRRY
jgi:hypothetical protein